MIDRLKAIHLPLLLAALTGLIACEPLTEEELAAYQQSRLQHEEQKRQAAARRAEACATDVYCYETQDKLAAQCIELAKREKSWSRKDMYGNTLLSEPKYVSGYLFDFGPLYHAGYGDNHRVRFGIGIDTTDAALPFKTNHTKYNAHCIIDKATLKIINISYEPIL